MATGLYWPLRSLPLALVGAALGFVVPGRAARGLAVGLAGWMLLHVAQEPWRQAIAAVDTERPVRLGGRVEGCWEAGDTSWRASLRLAVLEQGARTWRVSRTVRLYAASPPEGRPCGGQYRVRGYLRPPRAFENEPRVEVGEWSLFLESSRLLETLAEPGPWARAAATVRERLAGAGELESPGERLAWTLVTGETGRLPSSWVLAFRRWGLAHLVAVSGLHVGLLALLVGISAAPLPRSLRGLALLGAAGAYLLLAGPRPSLCRASLMLVLGVGAHLVRRPPSAWNGLALAVLGLLVGDPARIGDVGFQLSVAATGGILLFARSLTAALRRVTPGVAAALAVTVGAQLATLPWSLALFRRWTPWAPLANVVAAPWILVTLGLSFVWAVARLVSLAPVESAAGWLMDRLVRPLDALADLPPLPASSVLIGMPWATALGVSSLLLLSGWLALSVSLRHQRLLASALVLLALLLTSPACRRRAPAVPELVLFDVGQGDGILVRDGPHSLLLDAGGWDRPGFGARVVAPALARLEVGTPGMLAISHGDRDHCGGIADLARELRSRVVLHPEPARGDPCPRELLSMEWMEPRALSEGDVLRVGRWTLWVLAPPAGYHGSANGGSLVLRAQAFDRCVLLTGDVDAAAERRLLARWPPAVVRCDLLKVAHHGSRSSTSEPFLRGVAPRWALVSAGRGNAYGHPAEEVLGRLRRRNVMLLRTDRHGMVRVRFPGPGAVWIATRVAESRPPWSR
jgi:competence protein ComEC